MAHPHASLLQEFKIAIDKLPSTVPGEVVEGARSKLKELQDNPEVIESVIHAALADVGKQEFPYRRAYQEMVGERSEAEISKRVLEHVEPDVRKKLEAMLENDVTVDEFVKSELFETQFTGEERYQIQDGLMDAVEHVKEEMPETIQEKKSEYEALVKKWTATRDEMEKAIAELAALANEDAKWKDEIQDKVQQFSVGFSIVERDPSLQEIQNEIQYWRGTLAEDED